MAKIGVLGAGTWGMALSRMLSNSGHDITVWSALENEVTQYAADRRHPNLPGMVIPDRISFTKNGSYYDVDRGVEPDHIIDSYDHFFDREALTEYIHGLF